ncbi:F0F1-ATPase subunit family protein [Nocardiopsis sp. MG754419]|nr:F0F1-ATPase subunit family protein [Nocardiopsis sp. MG754419]
MWSAIGWGADRLLGFQALFLPIGAILGMVGAIFLIVAKTRHI